MQASQVQASLILIGAFGKNSIVSPLSMWLGDHVNGGLVALRLKPVYQRYFAQGQAPNSPPLAVLVSPTLQNKVTTVLMVTNSTQVCSY